METSNFYYDPQRQGYDLTVWKTITGTPAISSNLLRMNTAAAVGFADIYSADLTINATFPVAPVAGQDKRIGFAQLNMGAYVGFKISGAKFYYEAASPDTTISQTEITWDATWTAAPVAFRILWENNQVKFYIKLIGSNNEAYVGAINNTVALPKFPLSLYLKNANADNLDVTFVDLRNAVTVFPAAPISISVEDIEIGAVELKDGASDARGVINAANTARAATDVVVLTQFLDAAGNVGTVNATLMSPSTLTAGEKTVVVPGPSLALGTTLATKSIYIRAKSTNTGMAYIGDSTVNRTTSKQIILAVDDAVAMDIANRISVYVDADVNGEGVDYLCFS